MFKWFGIIGPKFDQIWAWPHRRHQWTVGVRDPLKSLVMVYWVTAISKTSFTNKSGWQTNAYFKCFPLFSLPHLEFQDWILLALNLWCHPFSSLPEVFFKINELLAFSTFDIIGLFRFELSFKCFDCKELNNYFFVNCWRFIVHEEKNFPRKPQPH